MAGFSGTPPVLSGESPGAILNWARQLEKWLRGQSFAADGAAVPAGTEGQLVSYDADGDPVAVDLETVAFKVRKFTKTYADFSAAAQEKLLNLAGPAAGKYWVVPFFFVKHSVPFTGGTVSSAGLDLGTTDDNDALESLWNVFAAAGADNYFFGSAPDAIYPVAVPPSDYVTAKLVVNVGSTTDELTAGAVEVWIWYSEITPA